MPHATRLAAALGLAAAAAATPLAAQTITVSADDYRQAWRGAGVALPANLAPVDALEDATRAELFRLGAGALDLGYLYDFPAGDPDARADEYARRTGYVAAVRAAAPGVIVVLGLDRFPVSLRRDTTIDGRPARRLDSRRPGIYGEVAAWYQAVLEAYAAAGVPVGMISLATAPDGDVARQGVPSYGLDADNPRADVARLYHLAVDSLEARLADSTRNPLRISMPLVLAPNGTGPAASADYLNHMRRSRNAAWDNVTVIGFQQFADESSPTAIQNLSTIAGGRPVLSTRIQANRGDDIAGFEALSAGHRGALSLAATFTAALGADAESFAYDRLAVTDRDDETGLLAVGSGAVEAPRRYAAFRQLTASQVRGARRVLHDSGSGFGLKVAAFRREGGDTLVVHVGNYSGPRTVTLDLREAGGGYATTLVSHAVTDADHAGDDVLAEVDTNRVTAVDVELGGFSVNTFTFAIPRRSTPTDSTTTGGGADTTGTSSLRDLDAGGAELVTRRQGHRLDVAATDPEVGLRSATLFDLGGRRVARAVAETTLQVVTFDLAAVPAGVYVVRAVTSEGELARRVAW